jgi:hypothetical protein
MAALPDGLIDPSIWGDCGSDCPTGDHKVQAFATDYWRPDGDDYHFYRNLLCRGGEKSGSILARSRCSNLREVERGFVIARVVHDSGPALLQCFAQPAERFAARDGAAVLQPTCPAGAALRARVVITCRIGRRKRRAGMISPRSLKLILFGLVAIAAILASARYYVGTSDSGIFVRVGAFDESQSGDLTVLLLVDEKRFGLRTKQLRLNGQEEVTSVLFRGMSRPTPYAIFTGHGLSPVVLRCERDVGGDREPNADFYCETNRFGRSEVRFRGAGSFG